MDKLKLIKSIVVIITSMLVFGSILLLTLIYKKTQVSVKNQTEYSLQQPNGSSIVSVTEVDENLAILVKGGGLADRIILYTPQTMQTISTLHLQEVNNE